MEISKIVIENFKGIEHVELSPVKPINVLIGRNNSGKSYILNCLKFLHEYFNTIAPKDTRTVHKSSKVVPSEYFRKGLNNNTKFSVTVTVTQSIEERTEQFSSIIADWNKQNNPQMTHKAIGLQLENDLFSSLRFKFITNSNREFFGLISINAHSKDDEGKIKDIEIAKSETPGGQLNRLDLKELFFERGKYRYPNLFDVEKKGFKNDLYISYEHGGLFAGKKSILPDYLIFPAFDYIKKKIESTFLLGSYRHGRTEVGAGPNTILVPFLLNKFHFCRVCLLRYLTYLFKAILSSLWF